MSGNYTDPNFLHIGDALGQVSHAVSGDFAPFGADAQVHHPEGNFSAGYAPYWAQKQETAPQIDVGSLGREEMAKVIGNNSIKDSSSLEKMKAAHAHLQREHDNTEAEKRALMAEAAKINRGDIELGAAKDARLQTIGQKLGVTDTSWIGR